MLAGLAVLMAARRCCSRRCITAGTGTCAAPGADDRRVTRTYGPPAPDEAWAGGEPDLHPLGSASGEPPK